MNITTGVDPVMGTEWYAYDSNTYDCDCDQDGFFSTSPMGHGKSEAEAIADLIAQVGH